MRKISPAPEFDPRTFEPVVSRYTNWATPAHRGKTNSWKNVFLLSTNFKLLSQKKKKKRNSGNSINVVITLKFIIFVMNVKCKSLYVRFYILILIFPNLYIEIVTVTFYFTSQLWNERSFTVTNSAQNCQFPILSKCLTSTLTLSDCLNCKIYLVHHFALINTPAFCWRDNSLEGTAVRRSLLIDKTVKTIIIIQCSILITMWHRFLILEGKPSWLS